MKYLNDNRIVYRRYSPDKPTQEYDWGWYYENGTYGYYSLFRSKALINSYKSLKWHLLTLWYLNPDIDLKKLVPLLDKWHDTLNGEWSTREIELVINVIDKDDRV